MSFAWVEYLAVAEGLVQQRGTLADAEACCRAAISRAYYAAFCAGVPVQSLQKVPISCTRNINDLESYSSNIFNEINTFLRL
jgi:hypothetical protein